MSKIIKTDTEWRQQLSDEEYRVIRQKGTEKPFSGEYDQFFENGQYHCKGCGEILFVSEDKFDAGCGWPSFSRPENADKLEEHADHSLLGRPRTEVTCQRCGAHLGHVFDDGPKQMTGMRYCINSVALQFEKQKP